MLGEIIFLGLSENAQPWGHSQQMALARYMRCPEIFPRDLIGNPPGVVSKPCVMGYIKGWLKGGSNEFETSNCQHVSRPFVRKTPSPNATESITEMMLASNRTSYRERTLGNSFQDFEEGRLSYSTLLDGVI
jgi:hypothetical protein